jgi:hypothetical protein
MKTTATKTDSSADRERTIPSTYPMTKGIAAAKRPVTTIRSRAERKIFWLISTPVMNRRRITPIVEKNWMTGVISTRLKSVGPRMIPAMISPISEG